MTGIFTNLALFIGLNGITMMLPPWRSARAQLHTRAHEVLQALASRFDAVAQGAGGCMYSSTVCH